MTSYVKLYPTVEAVIEHAPDADLRRYQAAFEAGMIGPWTDGFSCMSHSMFGACWVNEPIGCALSHHAMHKDVDGEYEEFKQEVYDMVLFELMDRAARDADHPDQSEAS